MVLMGCLGALGVAIKTCLPWVASWRGKGARKGGNWQLHPSFVYLLSLVMSPFVLVFPTILTVVLAFFFLLFIHVCYRCYYTKLLCDR